MNSKTIGLGLGALLIIIALILGAVRYSGYSDFGFAYGSGNGWYFYGLAGVIGLVGIIIAAWALMKKETSKATTTK